MGLFSRVSWHSLDLEFVNKRFRSEIIFWWDYFNHGPTECGILSFAYSSFQFVFRQGPSSEWGEFLVWSHINFLVLKVIYKPTLILLIEGHILLWNI